MLLSHHSAIVVFIILLLLLLLLLWRLCLTAIHSFSVSSSELLRFSFCFAFPFILFVFAWCRNFNQRPPTTLLSSLNKRANKEPTFLFLSLSLSLTFLFIFWHQTIRTHTHTHTHSHARTHTCSFSYSFWGYGISGTLFALVRLDTILFFLFLVCSLMAWKWNSVCLRNS